MILLFKIVFLFLELLLWTNVCSFLPLTFEIFTMSAFSCFLTRLDESDERIVHRKMYEAGILSFASNNNPSFHQNNESKDTICSNSVALLVIYPVEERMTNNEMYFYISRDLKQIILKKGRDDEIKISRELTDTDINDLLELTENDSCTAPALIPSFRKYLQNELSLRQQERENSEELPRELLFWEEPSIDPFSPNEDNDDDDMTEIEREVFYNCAQDPYA